MRRAIIVLSVVTTGCAPRFVVPAYDVSPTTPTLLHAVAGASKVDITPPAGFPTGGHGPAGAMSRGYWSHLYARAFYFAAPGSKPVVLVTCELFAIPGGLTAEVSRRVQLLSSELDAPIPPASIVIAATHTHQGPGNYMTARTYNEYGSKYQGFDAQLLEFLVKRVTSAILAARRDAVNGPAPQLLLHHGTMSDSLLLNRSPFTFLANWNAENLMAGFNPPRATCAPGPDEQEAKARWWDLPGCPRLRAIDRTLTVLEVTRGSARRALLVFAAAHPTVLYHEAPFYNADFGGQAIAKIENETRSADSSGLVVGWFNGAEGDIEARRGSRDMADVVRVAALFTAAISDALGNPGVPLTTSRMASRQAIIKPGILDTVSDTEIVGLANAPLFGAAALGGGEDDRTVLYQLGWQEGKHEIPGEGQGGKLGALDSQLIPQIRLTELLAPANSFPTELPVSLVRIGDLAIVALPVEASTATGTMIRRAVGGRLRTEIIGLANEYSSYAATSDEYEVQDYMAASTIWGPREAATLVATAACLSSERPTNRCADLFRKDTLHVQRKVFRPGNRPAAIRGYQLFGPSALGAALSAADDQLYDVVRRNGAPERNLPTFEWLERVDSDSEDFPAAAKRHVQIQVRSANGWVTRRVNGSSTPDDDLGTGLLLLMRAAPREGGTTKNERRWAAIWVGPILERNPISGEYRFDVRLDTGNGVETLESCPFSVDLSPATRAKPVSLDSGHCLQ
jgi:neutral ceramidase